MTNIMMHLARVVFFVLLAVLPAILHAEELELINRPVNISGMTGLLITTAPFTLPPRTVEVGISTQTENSLVPRYTSTTIPLTVSAGLSSNKELALLVPYRNVNEFEGGKKRGMGDTELSFKWNLLPQPEDRFRPAIALFGTGVFPTGDREAGMNSVNHWGLKLGISLGGEITWEDYIVGLYADGQGVLQDLSDEKSRDSYGIVNVGILFPISKYRNLQMLAEFSRRSGKDIGNVDGVDYSAMTFGLRLVGERFNLSLGSQFIHKSDPGYDNSNRIIGMTSMKF